LSSLCDTTTAADVARGYFGFGGEVGTGVSTAETGATGALGRRDSEELAFADFAFDRRMVARDFEVVAPGP
jgi:hypothetical protein